MFLRISAICPVMLLFVVMQLFVRNIFYCTGKTTVFIVSHPMDKETDIVEKFTLDAKRKVLNHVQSIEDPAFKL